MDANDLTRQFLERICKEPGDLDRLLALVYDELRAIGAEQLRKERAGHTLQPTALVNEAFVRMQQLREIRFEDRAHFCGVAAHVMRRVLVDHARKRQAGKRAHDRRVNVTLDELSTPDQPDAELDFLDLDEAIHELAALNPRHAHIIELRFFGGLSLEETAGVLGVSVTTIKDDWRIARAWLRSRMLGDGAR